jgi:hypothetical protein
MATATRNNRFSALEEVTAALQSFKGGGSLYDSATVLLNTLGYRSQKVQRLPTPTFEGFNEAFSIVPDTIKEDKALVAQWSRIDFLFQFGDTEVSGMASLFDESKINQNEYQSFLFVAVELKGNHYKRAELVNITRELNKPFFMPVIVLFHYDEKLTLSIIERRLHKRDRNKDVLEKVTLIKDVNLKNPHRAHQEILVDLSFVQLKAAHSIHNFASLLKAWKATLSISQLNKTFYEKLLYWYLYAVQNVTFPQQRASKGDEVPNDTHQKESIIRLLTRLLFCWFMREKQELIPEALFNQYKLKDILSDFNPADKKRSTYYQAILQNLFFATLSVPQRDRKFISKTVYKGINEDYGNTTNYRFEDYFVKPAALKELFGNIPFLNGGLFECLDVVPKKGEEGPEIRLDGFSTVLKKQAIVPNMLFWGEHKGIDLSEELGNPKKNNVTVYGLLDILSSYKFTIEENTPLDEEIALDPELLGRTFENLLGYFNEETHDAARNNTGSFYTPREIVDYMVDESLTAYLIDTLASNPVFKNHPDLAGAIRNLMAYTDAPSPFVGKEVDAVLMALDAYKIVDPACGSGAYPMGILQRMTALLRKLDPKNSKWFELLIARFPVHLQQEMRNRLASEEWDYLRKLGLIQQTIYGIDLQPIAIQISKLRFFISLLVDQRPNPEASNCGLRPLPNLDFKLVCANTLVHAPDSTVGRDAAAPMLAFADEFQGSFSSLTSEYFSASEPAEKKRLRDKIEALVTAKADEKAAEARSMAKHNDERYSSAVAKKNKAAIDKATRDARLWLSYTNLFKHEAVGFFENKYFFPEVGQGFFAVIGNPPYVQLQKLQPAQKAEMQAEADEKHYTTYTRTGDIYQLFYERGWQILRPGGYLCYISSNKWMRADYGERTRAWLSKETKTLALVDFGMAQVFESATTYTNVALLKKESAEREVPMCRVKTGDYTEGMSLSEYTAKHTAYIANPGDQSWVAYRPEEYALIKDIEKDGIVIGDKSVWNLTINRGILTGYNDAFIIPTEVRDMLVAEDSTSDEIIKPILRGEHVRAFVPEWSGEWLINSHNGIKELEIPAINVKRDYPAIYRWFNATKERREKLEKRFDKGSHWSNLRNCAYLRDFDEPKIIYPNMTKYLPFCYDEEGYMINDKGFILTGEHLKYLTVVLNSSVFKFAFRERFPELLGETREVRKVFFEKIPIRRPPDTATEKLFEGLVDAVQAATAGGNPTAVQLFTRLANAAVYELYFPSIRQDGAGVMEHIQNIFTGPGWRNKNGRTALAKLAYSQLSESKHPASIAMIKLSAQHQVQLIESTLNG